MRGVAVIAVVAHHLFLRAIGTSPAAAAFLSVLNPGRFGVLVFFLISGFVIPFSFSGAKPIRRFAIARFFRLYPAYWMSLAAASLALWLSNTLDPVAAMTNITMIQRALREPDLLGPYWTLFFELVFYLFCAMTFRLGLIDNIRWFARTGIVLLLLNALTLGLQMDWQWSEGCQFLGFMMAGTVFRRAYHEGDAFAQSLSKPLILAMIISIVFSSGLLVWVPLNAHAEFTPAALLTGGSLAMAWAIPNFWRNRSYWLLEQVGKISYSAYLLHGLFMLIMNETFGDRLGGLGYGLAVIALTVPASILSYRYVEHPMNDLGKRIIRRNTLAPAAA